MHSDRREENTMMVETIKRLAETAEWASVYTDREDTEHFSCGYILGATTEEVVLGSVTPYGMYDGFLALRTESIYAVEHGDRYTRKLQALYRAQGQSHPKLTLAGDGGLMCGLLAYARDNDLVVSLELFGSGADNVQGLVREIGDGELCITQLSDGGRSDGEICVLTEAVTAISCDSEEERALNMLRHCGLQD